MTQAIAKPSLIQAGPQGTATVNAASSEFSPFTTLEEKITAAIARAVVLGANSVYLPASFLPYTASLVTFNPAVQLMCEGGVPQTGVYDARAYGGVPNAWAAINTCVRNLPAAGGIVDCRSFVGAQVADSDVFFGVTVEKPIKLIFGKSVWSCTQGASASIGNLFGSQIQIELHETQFLLTDGQNQQFMWYTDITAGNATIAVTNGSATATLNGSPSRGVVPLAGKAIAIFGHTPSGGRDNTTLNGAIDNAQTSSIVLTAITGLMATNGTLRIDNEIITYTSFSGNTLVGAVRGAYGSTPASHLNLATVDRAVYDNYLIKSVAGLVLTLDRTVTLAPTMTAALAVIGPADITFSGTGVMDGNKPAADTSANGAAINFFFGTRLKTDRTIVFQNFDHGGVLTYQAQSCVIDGNFREIGWPLQNLGFAVLFFNGSKWCTAYGDYEHVNQAISTDDRSVTPTDRDNACDGCLELPRNIHHCLIGVHLEGTSKSYASAPRVDDWNCDGAVNGAAGLISGPQWVTAGVGFGNMMDIGYCNPTGANVVAIAAGCQNSFIIVRMPGCTVSNAGGETNVIWTHGAVAGINYGALLANPVQFGDRVVAQALSGTSSQYTALSPDGGCSASLKAFNGGPAEILGAGAFPLWLATNGLLRWQIDIAGRLIPDTTNGGARLERSIALVSGVAPAIDASQGNLFTLTILTNIAVVLAVPTNPPAAGLSQTIDIVMRNGSGGALTTPPTFNTGANGFKFSTVTNPANGTEVVYRFKWDPVQSFWYEVGTHQAAGL